MQAHCQIDEHQLALSFSDLSVWCYACMSYVDNPTLHKFKNLAHLNKFGENLVWSYGENLSIILDQVDQAQN